MSGPVLTSGFLIILAHSVVAIQVVSERRRSANSEKALSGKWSFAVKSARLKDTLETRGVRFRRTLAGERVVMVVVVMRKGSADNTGG